MSDPARRVPEESVDSPTMSPPLSLSQCPCHASYETVEPDCLPEYSPRPCRTQPYAHTALSMAKEHVVAASILTYLLLMVLPFMVLIFAQLA